MPVKTDQALIDDLSSIGLVVWDTKHPKIPFYNDKTMKTSQREDKSWVLVTLAGPGVEEAHAGGPDFATAVKSALIHSGLCDRVPGVSGAMLRLERAVWDLGRRLAADRMAAEYDDDIPF